MNQFDLLLRQGRVVTPEGTGIADVAVAGGRIVQISRSLQGQAKEEVDAGGLYLLPGVIDAHTHPVYADDLESMCVAGIRAGVTTVISFVGAVPAWGFQGPSTSRVVSDYIKNWDGRVAADFALHAAFTGQDELQAEIPKLSELGVSSFKLFLAYPRRGMMMHDNQLMEGFRTIADHGGLAVIHCENGYGIEFLEQQARSGSPSNADYLPTHPELFEAEAMFRAVALASAVGCSIYIPHVSTELGIRAVELANTVSSVPIFLETCPHYLLLTNDAVLERGSQAKIAPPLRSASHREGLWRAIADRAIDVVATDHAGRTVAEKSVASSVLDAPYGAEGIEHLLPLMFNEGVRAGRISMEILVDLLCHQPARIFGLAPKKGSISVGGDADLVLFDPDAPYSLSARDHVGKSDYCLYEGFSGFGSVVHTYRRGQLVFSVSSGVESTRSSGGRFVRRGIAS